MKIPARLLAALAASCVAFVGSASAQLQTFSTYAGFTNSTSSFADEGGTLFQTFTNVSAVHSMTFNFFTSSSTTGGLFSATFGQWNGTSFVNGTTVSFSNFTVPGSGSWSTQSIGSFTGSTFEQLFSFTNLSNPLINPTYGYLTNSASTYAMVLTDQGSSTNISLGRNATNPFAYGQAGNETANRDYVFSQITVAPGTQQLVPVPESSTIAALAGAVLVSGLVIVRTRQRRQNNATAAA